MGFSHRTLRSTRFYPSCGWMLLSLALGVCFTACGQIGGPPRLSNNPVPGRLARTHLRALDFSNPIQPVADDAAVELAAAKNEAISFGLEVSDLPDPADPIGPLTLSLQTLQLSGGDSGGGGARIAVDQYAVYQVLNMPVDLTQAAFVRHTGLATSAATLPRALLPVHVDRGTINLSDLRDPRHPRDPHGRAGGPGGAAVELWIDLSVPPTAQAGDYAASCDLMQGSHRNASVPVKLHVHDFLIPDDRHLAMVGRLDWDALVRLYGPEFETVTPYLLSRREEKYAPAIKTLDALVKLAQAHRLQAVVPRLQPQVKWPAAELPQIGWEDFDSVVSPWLQGTTFTDHVPLAYWPLPAAEYVEGYDQKSQGQYWFGAAAHFDQLDWLSRSPIVVEKPANGRDDVAENLRLSERAGQLLAFHPRVKVLLPLEDDELAFKSPRQPTFVDPSMLDRVITAAPGLVFRAHLGNWPDGLGHPAHWLRTDAPGLIPYAGAGGDEQDVRLWAWLAYLRKAQIIQWGATLPDYTNPDQPADPGEVVWFYPGQWFGVDEPVPTVQLKWLRRAEQDYEYLHLAWERGEQIKALVMARLITKPVQIDLLVTPDPTYSLMSGTTDPKAWTDVKDLLAQTILLRAPGRVADTESDIDLNASVTHWSQPQEKPLMLGRTVQWGWSVHPGKQGGNWVDLRLGLDVYNAADQPLAGHLQWTAPPPGWELHPQPVPIPLSRAVGVFKIARYPMDACVDLDKVVPQTRQPVELAFVNELHPGTPHRLEMMLPVAVSERHEGQAIKIDGDLSEWDAADALQDGPLVKMFDRPMIQKQALEYADTPTQVYSTWGARNFYVAFKVAGILGDGNQASKNYVDYPSRRAWGEDLCEVLIQPIYADNSLGPVTHLVLKPHAQLLVESKLDRRQNADPWQTILGADVRYGVSAIQNGVWRGEIAIPWDVINDAPHRGVRPALLRFNFSQHKNSTGQSATWAGPVDFGRDDAFMGLLYLREEGAQER